MNEMVTWLRAQLDVDEANAYDVHDRECQSVVMTWTDWTTPKFVGPCDCGWPERVLAEVTAKRAILTALDEARARQDANSARFAALTSTSIRNALPDPQLEYVQTKTHGWELSGQVAALQYVVRLLAVPYADLPGYREEWRP